MIQGVHAETVAFIDFKRATTLFLVPGWTWLGLPGQVATRQLRLKGTPPRDCRLRVTRTHVLPQTASCTVQLESREGTPGTPLIRGELTLAPAPNSNANSRCVLSIQGLAARNLADTAGPASAEATRRLANEYARSLLEQVAGSLERDGAKLSAG